MSTANLVCIVCAYIHEPNFIYIWGCIYIYMSQNLCMCVCVCVYIYIYIYICEQDPIFMCVYIKINKTRLKIKDLLFFNNVHTLF